MMKTSETLVPGNHLSHLQKQDIYLTFDLIRFASGLTNVNSEELEIAQIDINCLKVQVT